MSQYYILPDARLNTENPQSGFTKHIGTTSTLTAVTSKAWSKFGAIELNNTAAGTQVWGYDLVDGISDNIEIAVNFGLTSDTGKQGIASLRYSGASEATTKGYTLSGSIISGVGNLAIDEGSTGYAAWTPWNYLPADNDGGNLYFARFRIDGNRLRAKVWTMGGTEPDWMLDTTNDVTTTGNFNGLHTYMSGNVDYFGVGFGTNGDSAPATIEEYNQWKRDQIDAANNALPSSTPIVGFSGGYGGPFAGYGSALGLAKRNTGLVIDSSLHGHTVTSPVLNQAHRVAIANATHAHAATSPAIKQLHNLLIANTVHSITSTSPVIAINHNLAIDNATHQIVSDSVIMVTGFAAVPQDAVHNLTSDNISLQQYQTLIVQSATHTHTVTSPTIIEAKRLAISSTAHSLNDSGIGKLDIVHYLAVGSTTHNLSSLSPTILQANLLVVQSTSHAMTSTSVDIIQFTLLGKPDDTVHGLASDHISLSQKQILAIDSTIHPLKSGEIAKIFDWTELGVDFGDYKPGWNNSGKLTVAVLDDAGDIPSGGYRPNPKNAGVLDSAELERGNIPSAGRAFTAKIITNEIYSSMQTELGISIMSEDGSYILVMEYNPQETLTNVSSGGTFARAGTEYGILQTD